MEGFVDFAGLLRFLETNKFPHNVNREAQLVELPSNAQPLLGNLLVKWEKKIPFVSFVQFMIDAVPEDRIAAVETAITRLNCALEVPGLGFDHTTRRLYFRIVVPVLAPPVGIPPQAFHSLGKACVAQAQETYPGMKAVVEGRDGAQILSFAGELLKKSREAAAGGGNLA